MQHYWFASDLNERFPDFEMSKPDRTDQNQTFHDGSDHWKWMSPIDKEVLQRSSPMTAEHKRLARQYTRDEAHKALPLVTSIVRDIVELNSDLEERRERLGELRVSRKGPKQRPEDDPYEQEFRQMEDELSLDDGRLQAYRNELEELGVEMRDLQKGAVEFSTAGSTRLIWRLGDSEISEIYPTSL